MNTIGIYGYTQKHDRYDLTAKQISHMLGIFGWDFEREKKKRS